MLSRKLIFLLVMRFTFVTLNLLAFYYFRSSNFLFRDGWLVSGKHSFGYEQLSKYRILIEAEKRLIPKQYNTSNNPYILLPQNCFFSKTKHPSTDRRVLNVILEWIQQPGSHRRSVLRPIALRPYLSIKFAKKLY